MNDTALVVDSEYVDKIVSQICGREFRPDPVKIRDYFARDHHLLWTRWYVKAPVETFEDGGSRRQAFLDIMRSKGIRIVSCASKPVTMSTGIHEENTCDFHVVEGIHLARKKASTVIIATGDGHLKEAINRAHDPGGCRVEVLCRRGSVSSLLEADQFHYLEDICSTGVELTHRRRISDIAA